MGCLNSNKLITLITMKTDNKSKEVSNISDIDLFSGYFDVKHKSKDQTLSPNIKCSSNINNHHYTLLTNCNSMNTNHNNNTSINTSPNVLKKVSSQDTSALKTDLCLTQMRSSLIESVSDDTTTKYLNDNNCSFDKSSTDKLSLNNLHSRKSLFQQNSNFKGLVLEIHITDSQTGLTTAPTEIVSPLPPGYSTHGWQAPPAPSEYPQPGQIQ